MTRSRSITFLASLVCVQEVNRGMVSIRGSLYRRFYRHVRRRL